MVVLEMQLQIHIILQDLLRHPSKNDAGALRETGDNRYCCMKVCIYDSGAKMLMSHKYIPAAKKLLSLGFEL